MAAIGAEAPGIGETLNPRSHAARTRSYPGSETAGIPASEIKATSPDSSAERMDSSLDALLCSK